MSKRKDPKPDILRIEELVYKVKIGDIKLPKFQRPFVWKKNDITKLLDSIYKGYPIGSILLWLTKSTKLASERKIGDLEIDDRPDEFPTYYLLDGQQRLSTLCGALYWNGNNINSQWNIGFDLDKEQFVFQEHEKKIGLFPLNKLIDTREFNKQCQAFGSVPEKEEKYYERANRLLSSIKDYKVAAVQIGDMTIDEVAPIFERINSTGRKLEMVDLMRAATWKGGFDLNDAINTVKSGCKDKNFNNIPDSHILRNISACSGLGIHKEAIGKLRDKSPDKLKEAAKQCLQAYKLTVDFLTTELPLPSIDYLPYSLQLTYLVEFFNINPEPSLEQREELKIWFWETSVNRYFGAANTGLITKTLEQIRQYARGKIESLKTGKPLNIEGFLKDTFTLNKASSKTLAIVMANEKPKSLLTGQLVDTYKALSLVNRLEYHHIFPKAYLERQGFDERQRNFHANICMLNLGNNREISDKKPSDYFREMKSNLGDSLSKVLLSNFINDEALRCALEDDYDGFIENRILEMTKRIKNLISRKKNDVEGFE